MDETLRLVIIRLLRSSLDPYVMAPSYIECHNALEALLRGDPLDEAISPSTIRPKERLVHEDAHLEAAYEDRFYDRMDEEIDGDLLLDEELEHEELEDELEYEFEADDE